MSTRLDLTGVRYGALVVSNYSRTINHKTALWLCTCDCGKQIEVRGASLKNGHTKSCGCTRGKSMVGKVGSLSRSFKDHTGKRVGRLTVLGLSKTRIPVGKRGGKRQRGCIWLCRCDCGTEKEVEACYLVSAGVKSCGCYRRELARSRVGAKSRFWKGGRVYNTDGYVRVASPEHPKRAKRGSYVLEHILVMEQVLGRFLTNDETVHHKNGIRDDNRPENLELWSSSHPPGQRVKDIVQFAKEVMKKYPEFFQSTPIEPIPTEVTPKKEYVHGVLQVWEAPKEIGLPNSPDGELYGGVSGPSTERVQRPG